MPGIHRSFYADLYSAEPVVQTDMRRILELVDRLSSSLTAWDGEITVEECVSAINGMENNKTPGSDGIPKEFYSKFFSPLWNRICGNDKRLLQSGPPPTLSQARYHYSSL